MKHITITTSAFGSDLALSHVLGDRLVGSLKPNVALIVESPPNVVHDSY